MSKRTLEADIAVVRHVYVCTEGTWVHTSTDPAWALQTRAKIREIDASPLNEKGGFLWNFLGFLSIGEFDEEVWADVPEAKKIWDWFSSSKPAAASTIDEWKEVSSDGMENVDEGPFESLTAFHCAKRHDLFYGNVMPTRQDDANQQ
jgi:hypothetical protein